MLKEHFLTLIAGLATLATILTFTFINRTTDQFVFDSQDVLFEHQVASGKLIISNNYYDQVTLAFLDRNILSFNQVDSTTANLENQTIHLLLPTSEAVPFTTHVVLSSNPKLHEILVIEEGNQIALHARSKEAVSGDKNVFMVSSPDISGANFTVFGLDANGEIIYEIY